MIVTLTEKQIGAMDFWASRGYATWQAIYDALEPLDEGDEYGVNDDIENAEAVMDAYHEDMDAGHDPLQGVTDDVRAVAQRIVDHMDYGLAYGFEERDWE